MGTASSRGADIAISQTIAALDRAKIPEYKIINELKIIAFSDLKHHVRISEDGSMVMIPLEDMGAKSRAVRKVKEKTTIMESKDGATLSKISNVEYELYDKMAALELLAAMRGMKTQHIALEHTVGTEVPDAVREILASAGGADDPK